jgi:SAM-dependent methyltransferase
MRDGLGLNFFASTPHATAHGVRDQDDREDMVHEVAAAGFGDAADYEAARPSYPADAVAWLVDELRIGPGARVCDLAAGTGKLTRILVRFGADLVAVEPVAGMRAQFRAVLPDVPLLAGAAEAMPCRTAALDAVVVAQAWHWFEHAHAEAEMRRVLQPRGGFALVWNARDRGVPWVDELWSIMDRVEKRAPWRDHENWRESARDVDGFASAHTAQFHHEQSLTHEQVVQRIASVSHVAVLPHDQRAQVLDEVRAVLQSHDETRDRADVALPYRVDCIVYGPA